MKRKILFILFMCVGYICVYAQGKDGSSYYNAIPIMIQNNRFSFFDTKNTAVATGAYTLIIKNFLMDHIDGQKESSLLSF